MKRYLKFKHPSKNNYREETGRLNSNLAFFFFFLYLQFSHGELIIRVMDKGLWLLETELR